MKKSAFLLLSAFVFSAVFFFTSCEKPPITGDNVIEAKDVKSLSQSGLDNVDMVKAVIAFISSTGIEVKEIASCKFEKNGFTLTLPDNIPDNYLLSLDAYEYPGITINPKNAKQGSIEIVAYDKTENIIGAFNLASDNYFSGSSEASICGAGFSYCDRHFTIKGTLEKFPIKYNCSFKKGWNISYLKIDGKTGFFATTSKPSGVKFKWYFLEEGYLLAPKKDSCPLITHEQIISMMPSF